MKRTFVAEDDRKTQLFGAWSEYLGQVHEKLENKDDLSLEFEEFYEGLANITDLSENHISLLLETGEKIAKMEITAKISELSCRLDMIFIVMGKFQEKWWPIEVISIGSFLGSEKENLQEFHMTVNPDLIQPKH